MLQPDPHVHQPDAILLHQGQVNVEEETYPTGQSIDLQSKNRIVADKRNALRRTQYNKKLKSFGLGVLFLTPALIVFAIFIYYPLFRAFWLSLNITNELGDPVKFVGLRYYANVLNLDHSNDEYLQSLLT